MKILVTGGSGFLGTHVRKFFNADDFSRRSDLDVLNLQDVYKAEDYDVVIHLAAQLDKTPESAEEVFLNNVEGTVNLLKAIRENAVFIFASTKDVYGRFADNFDQVPETCQTIYSGQTALEWSKLIAEQYVTFYSHKNHFRSCIFRLSNVYAPLSDDNTPSFVTYCAEKVKKGEEIKLPGDGRPIRDFLYVTDFARACEAFSDSIVRHGIYNLGGGPKNALSLRNFVEMLGEVSGLKANIDSSAKIPNPIPLNYVSDLTLIKQELEWEPHTPVKEGLSKLF